jgi:putative PIN family toxin of toxin-antitoxin system
LRVVLDINVLISAFVFPGGPPEAVFRLGLESRIELVTSPALLAEFARVLDLKFGWESTRVDAAVRQVLRLATVVRPASSIRFITDDPDDDRVLEAAIEAGAEVIVSGDRHVLAVGEWNGISIRRAVAFLEWVASSHD